MDAGRALTVIRDARLYRETHATFEAYCRERWQMSRPRAYQLISAAGMSTTVDNERQARALRAVKEEEVATASPAWVDLLQTIERVEALWSGDATELASAVPPRRRGATARRLRKLGSYIGRIAWALERSEGEQ